MCSLWFGALPANADTVAYWRFEEGPANALLDHPAPDGAWFPSVADSSGNGNALSAWSSGAWANSYYRSDVPAATIPLTGASNDFSIRNAGGYPGLFTTAGPMQTMSPAQFTIEAAFKPENGGYRTIVGRDSRGAGTVDGNAAALYFQIQPGNAVAITFEDVAGYQHSAVSAPELIHGFDYPTDPQGNLGTWYAMAAVSNGATLSLYLNDLSGSLGYQLVAQSDMMVSGSPNTALTTGAGSGPDWQAGNWTIGRGLYAGAHVDRAYGYIDEVRLSDSALSPGQFLFAGFAPPIPEPESYAMLLAGLGLLGFMARRRKQQAA